MLYTNSQSSPHGNSNISQENVRFIECLLCKGPHYLNHCDQFQNMSLDEREKFVKSQHACINCLKKSHIVTHCRKQSFCKVPSCKGKHAVLLHRDHCEVTHVLDGKISLIYTD